MCIATLSLESVLLIHDRMIKREGGLPGVHLSKLEGALSRIDAMIDYEGVEDVYQIAAQYGIAISQGHPFNDANKRTSLSCMLLFLRGNQILCDPPDEESTITFVRSMANKEFSRTEIAEWLKKHSRIHSNLLALDA